MFLKKILIYLVDLLGYKIIRRESFKALVLTSEQHTIAISLDSTDKLLSIPETELIGKNALSAQFFFNVSQSIKIFILKHYKKTCLYKASIVHIGSDLYQSTCEVLWGLYHMKALQDGCVLLFDDWNPNRANPNCGERRALKEFLAEQPDFTVSPWFSYGHNGNAFILHDINVSS